MSLILPMRGIVVVEEAGGSQHDRGRLQVVPAVQEELSVTVALGGGLGEPGVNLFLVMSVQIQLAEGILSILVSDFSGLGEVARCLDGGRWYDVAFEIFLAQPVGSVFFFIVCGTLQPPDSQLGVMVFRITGEQQFSLLVLCCRMALPCRLLEPVEGFHAFRDQHRTVLVEFAGQVLGVAQPLGILPLEGNNVCPDVAGVLV